VRLIIVTEHVHQHIRSNQNTPSPGRRLRDDQLRELPPTGLSAQRVASHRPPSRGLPHASPGAERDGARSGSVEGCPRADVWPGLRQVDGTPHNPQHHCKIVSGHVELVIVWILYGHKTHPDNPRKPQTTSVYSRENHR
jgi:hypothetical protein